MSLRTNMASLHESLKVLLSTPENSRQASDYFQGISRKYFPRWEGWDILDYGGVPSDLCVMEFYKEFFWGKIQGDLIESQDIADLLLTFATISGKRKMTSKLQRVLNTNVTGILSDSDIIAMNASNPNEVFLGLLAEFVELYVSVNTPERIKPLLGIYYAYLNSTKGLK